MRSVILNDQDTFRGGERREKSTRMNEKGEKEQKGMREFYHRFLSFTKLNAMKQKKI